jgi:broad specificity phosphatase PhoE
LNVQPCEAANEIDFGEWTGKSFEELEPLPAWRRFNRLRSIARIPGGESMPEAQIRMVSELECMRRRHPGQHVALFSHGDPIKAAIAHCAGIPLDLFHRIDIAPASVSVVSLDESGPRILRVNDTGEL